MASYKKYGLVAREVDARPLPQLTCKLVTVGNSTQEADYAGSPNFMHGEWWYVVNGSWNPESNLFAVNKEI